MVGKDEVRIRITADSSAVAAGVRPATAALDAMAATAAKTDEAIAHATARLGRLREQFIEGTRLGLDTRKLRLEMAEVERSIKTLQKQHTIPVDVDVDTSELAKIDRALSTVQVVIDRTASRLFPLSRGGRYARGLSSAIGLFQRMGGASKIAALGLGGVEAAAVGATAGIAALATAWAALGVVTAPAAANMEAMATSVKVLTGNATDAAAAMQLMRDFSESTGFSMAEIDEATTRLLASGTNLAEIPHLLEIMGDVARATNKPLSDISLVFGQMLSKGKLYTEDINQLADRGIPAWDVLAEKLHTTTGEVRELAKEGKLRRREMELMIEGLGERTAGAAAESMGNLVNKVQDLRNDINLLAADIGRMYLPVAKELVDIADTTVQLVDWEVQAFGALYDKLSKFLGQDFFEAMMPNLKLLQLGLKWLLDHLPDFGKSTDFKWPEPDPEGEAVEQLQDEEDATKELESQVRDLESAWKDAVDELGKIGGAHRAKVDFIIDQADLDDEIEKAINGVNEKGTKDDIPPVRLPVNLTMGNIGDLTEGQEDLFKLFEEKANGIWEEAARRETTAKKWGLPFDEKAFIRGKRQELIDGIMASNKDMTEEDANRIVTNLLGVPPVWKIKPRLEKPDNINQQLKDLFPSEINLGEVDPKFPQHIKDQIETHFGSLRTVAGEGFAAPILPEIDDTSLNTATTTLDTLTEDREVKVTIKPVEPFQIPGDPFMQYATPSGGRRHTPSADDIRTPTVTSGRQAPVLVYVDGEQVGAVIERNRRHRHGSGRRRP